MTHERRPADGALRHRECWERIPWLANETLSPRDYARIEPHLRTCRECQEELALQRSVRDSMRTDEAVVLAPQTALQKLMQRIDADESASEMEAPQPQDAATSEQAVTRRPRWLAIAAALQGVAIALLLANQWRVAENSLNAPRFTTLSEPGIAAGPVIRVVFASGVALNEVNAMLRSVNAQIIAGPSEAGVYTLALGKPAGVDAGRSMGLEDALAHLRTDSRVVFAESAVTRVTQ